MERSRRGRPQSVYDVLSMGRPRSVRVATTGMTTLNHIDDDATTNTTCSICHKAFQVPKILPCSHTFCQACLLARLNVLDTPQCPTCSCDIADHKLWADRDAEEWKRVVDALPTDLVTEAVVESARELSKGLSCAGCRDSAAVSVCKTCGDKFCRFCASVHRNTSMSRHHKVENLSSMTPETFAEIRPAVCSSHSNVPAEFFCSAHEAAICQRCAATQHRACPEVKSYYEEKEKFRGEIEVMSSNLKAAAKKIEQAISDLDQRSVDMRDKQQKALDEIDRDYHQLEKALKTCQRRLKRQAEDDLSKAKDRVRTVKGTLHRRKEGLQAHRVSLQRLKRSMPSKVVTDHKARLTLKSQISDLDTIVTLPAEVKSDSKAPPRIYTEWLKVVDKEMKGVVPAPKALGYATRTSFTQVVEKEMKGVLPAPKALGHATRTSFTQVMEKEWKGVDPAPKALGYATRTSFTQVVEKEMKGVVPAPKALGYATRTSFTQLGDSWRCSPACGSNIVLSNSRRTAHIGVKFIWPDEDKPQRQPHGGIITTMHEMSENVMYAIRLNQAEAFKRKGQHLPCGVVVKPTGFPPDTARWRWDSAVVLSDAVFDRGQKKDGSALGDKLVGLPTGSEVGVMIDSLRRLHLFINEKDVITISDVTIPYSPCYAFFDIGWGYKQVSTLPPKQAQKKCQPTGDVTFFA